MSWSGAITALEAHMAAAAPAYAQRSGETIPASITLAWWYEGSGENPLIPETLTDHAFAENVSVRCYWPVATRDPGPSRALEMEARNITRTLIARLEADRSLGENVTDTAIGDATAGWLDLGGASFRVVTIPLSLGFTDEEPIAR